MTYKTVGDDWIHRTLVEESSRCVHETETDLIKAVIVRALAASAALPVDERAAFEAVAKKRGYDVERANTSENPHDYSSLATQVGWDFWMAQAESSARSKIADQVAEEVRQDLVDVLRRDAAGGLAATVHQLDLAADLLLSSNVSVLTPAQIDDMGFGYVPSAPIGELRDYAAALLATANVAVAARPTRKAVSVQELVAEHREDPRKAAAFARVQEGRAAVAAGLASGEPIHRGWAVYYNNLGKEPYSNAFMTPFELFASEAAARERYSVNSEHYQPREVVVHLAESMSSAAKPVAWLNPKVGLEWLQPKPAPGTKFYTHPASRKSQGGLDIENLFQRALLNITGDTWRDEMQAALDATQAVLVTKAE